MGEWIDVSERTPYGTDDVLVFVPGEGTTHPQQYVAFRDGDGYWWVAGNGAEIELPVDVTHWQPLPAPPTTGGH